MTSVLIMLFAVLVLGLARQRLGRWADIAIAAVIVAYTYRAYHS